MNTELPLKDLLPNKIVWINLAEFENLCFRLAKEHLVFDEPIPEFITFFYLLIKNHPFRNGNKRVAIASLFVILYLNKLWLSANELEPYKLAKKVARSKSVNKEKTLKNISGFITKHLTKF